MPQLQMSKRIQAFLVNHAQKKVNAVLINLLNDLQFSYDGSVHYRQKWGL